MSDPIHYQRIRILQAIQRRAIERQDASLLYWVGHWMARINNLLPETGVDYELNFDTQKHNRLWKQYSTAAVIEVRTDNGDIAIVVK